MPATSPPAITALPAPPDPANRSTFNTLSYPWSVAQQTLATQQTAVASNMATNAQAAMAAAQAAEADAAAAAADKLAADASAATAATQAAAATTANGTAGTQAAAATTAGTAATVAGDTAQAKAAEATAAAQGIAALNARTSTAHPISRPALLLDFANTQRADPRITFTRASTATRTNSRGLVEAVASGTPRIDFDPITLACKGLLVEESRTNLLTYSQDFDNGTAWGGAGLTIAANAAVAPDGTVTADKIVATATLAEHARNRFTPISVSANTAHTVSVYAKAAELTQLYIALANSTYSSSIQYVFTLTGSGSVGNAVLAGSASANSASITAVGSGWYRCSVTGIVDASSTALNHNFSTASGGTSYYTGDGTSGLFVWGAQLEAGAFPTSYIPTAASSVTRAADVPTMTGSNFSSWYRPDEGTFTGVTEQAHTLDRYILTVTKGLGTYGSRYQLTNSRNPTLNNVNDALAVDGTIGTATSRNPHAWAFAYKTNDYAMAAGGVLGTPDTSVALPSGMAEMRLGVYPVGINALNGHIRRIAYYPQRLTNAQLQLITAQ